MFALLTRVVSKIATVFHNSNYAIARGFNLVPVSTRFRSFSVLLFKPVTSCYYICSASEFIRKLDKLYRDMNTTAALTEDSFPGVKINMSCLRSSMDLCLEQLPTLLKIEVGGALPVTQLLPRVLSQLRALSVYSESGSSVGAEERMSETMGYVIQMVRLDSIFFLINFFKSISRRRVWKIVQRGKKRKAV